MNGYRRVAAATGLAWMLGLGVGVVFASSAQAVTATQDFGNLHVGPYANQTYTVFNHKAEVAIPSGQTFYLNANVKIGAAAHGDIMEVTPKIVCSNGINLTSGINLLTGVSGIDTINTRGMVTGPAIRDISTWVLPHNVNNTTGGTVYIYRAETFLEVLGGDWTGRYKQTQLTANHWDNNYFSLISARLTPPVSATAVGAFFDSEITSCPSSLVDDDCAKARILPGHTESRVGYQLYVVQYNSDDSVCTILGGLPPFLWKTVTYQRHHEDTSGYVNSLPLSSACSSRNVRAVIRFASDGNTNGFYVNGNSWSSSTGNTTRVGVYSN